jgi:uncharacterized BrkB/YihY/UPF0761 family membrane protein
MSRARNAGGGPAPGTDAHASRRRIATAAAKLQRTGAEAATAAKHGELQRWASTMREGLEHHRIAGLPLTIYARYREIDGRNQAILIATKLFLSLMPLAILGFAATTAFASSRSFAEVMNAQFGLGGGPAAEVRRAFASADQAKVALGLIAIASFAYSGYDVPATLQRVYARAWRTEQLAGAKAWLRGGLWLLFFVAMTVAGEQLAVARTHLPAFAVALSWPVAILAGFVVWLVTPRLLLHHALSWRELVPSGLIGMVVTAALRGFARWAMPRWLTEYAHPFGTIGVAMGILFWLLLTCYTWVIIAAATAVVWERNASAAEVQDLELGADGVSSPRRDAPLDGGGD